MTSQTPPSLGTNVIKQQHDTSTKTANMALTSEDDLTLREYLDILTHGDCMPGAPESKEIDDCILKPAVKSPQANADRLESDVIPEKVSLEEALVEAGIMETVTKLERRLEALERFPKKRPRQSATPEQRNPGEYLAEQRAACKRMLKREMKACQKEEGWDETWCWVGGGDWTIRE